MVDTEGKSAGAWPVVLFAAILLILVALITKLFLVAEGSTALVIGIAAITGLLVLSPRVFELTERTVSKDGRIAKIEVVEQKIEKAEQDIKKAERKIDQIFAYTMSDSMFSNLRKLAGGNFGHFRNNGGLRRELRHLRDVGYISVAGHVGDLPDEGTNLSDHVKVTPVGREFVALRESMEAKSGPSPVEKQLDPR